MKLKKRSKSSELLVWRSLNVRMINLSEDDKSYYEFIERGYEGELLFDQKCEVLSGERYIIEDLQLEVKRSLFQIDTLIISHGVIHFLDVKTFQGECYFKDDKFYSAMTGREYKNPLIQLKRASTLFRQLLQILKFHHRVEAHVVFINPDFTLYLATADKELVLPTQVNRFLDDINKLPSKLTAEDQKLAQKLLSLHVTETQYTQLPKYTYEDLKLGIYCKDCSSFEIARKHYGFECPNCGQKESTKSAIVRTVKEYQILFPEKKVTTTSIHEWICAAISKKIVFRILNQNLTKKGSTFGTYFE